MRDPNRIDGFLTEFGRLWKDNCSDWRFGQLCSNFFAWLLQEKGRDCFFPEEDKILGYLREYFGE